MITHILVPVDFGESDSQSIEHALSIAEKFDSKITLLHSSWLPRTGDAGSPGIVAWPLDDIERNAKSALAPLFEKVAKRWPKVEVVYATGEPWEQILENARLRKVDLIVMGTHGRRGISRLLIGSVAEKVVRLSPIPVLTVSAAGHAP